MATVLDVGLIEFVSPLLTFVFVWAMMFAIMQALKIPGEDKNIHSVIAVVVALLVMVSPAATRLITFISPWFAFFFIGLIFIILAIKIIGVTDGDIHKVVTNKENRYIVQTVITIGIVIAIIGLANEFGQDIGPFLDEENSSRRDDGFGAGRTSSSSGDVASGDFQQNLYATLFHPKILGMSLLLVIASFTIRFLSRQD